MIAYNVESSDSPSGVKSIRYAAVPAGMTFLLVILLVLGGYTSGDRGGSERPNIVLIMSDDMGYSDIGAYGGEIRTPNLDALADAGLRFSQFYNTARCVPTRAALLTGLYPAQTGAGFMIGDQGLPGYRGDLNRQSVTLAEVLKSAGYSTYMSGKWHVTRQLEDIDSLKYNWPRQRGFDRFYGTITGAGSFWDPWTLTRGNTFITPENDPEYQPDRFYYTDAISDNAVRYIQEHLESDEEDPFFMYVSYTAAHWPLHAPEEEIEAYEGMYDDGYQSVRTRRVQRLHELGLIDPSWDLTEPVASWDTLSHRAWHARNMEVYAAMVTRMDKGIGEIVRTLEREGALENTVILYLQDNGACAEVLDWVGEPRSEYRQLADAPVYDPMGPDELQTRTFPLRNRDGYPVVIQSEQVMAGSDQTYHAYGPTWANVSNTPFREFKHWVHEGGIATPLIVHWPAAIADEGEIRRQPSHIIDVMATAVDLADAHYPTVYQGNEITPMEGESLVPVFLEDATPARNAIFFEHEGNRAVRQGKWKLVSTAYDGAGLFIEVDTLATNEWELFDMEADRTETVDLADEHPQRVEEMAELWTQWAARTNTIPKPK